MIISLMIDFLFEAIGGDRSASRNHPIFAENVENHKRIRTTGRKSFRLKGSCVSRLMSPLFRNRLGYRLALVENIQHDVACRLVAEVLLSVDGAARNVVALAGLEHDWGLSLDGEGDFALLDRGPLIAGVAMELVAAAGRQGNGYHLYFARRVFLQGRREISDGLAIRRRRLRPCGGREHAGCCKRS